METWHWYRGAIHIHSVYSDGDGTLDAIIEAGREADLDYVIITDHNTLRARDRGYEGWHGSMLAAVGEEVSYLREHCLALGANGRINGRQPTRRIIEDIETGGGISVVVHPHGRYKKLFHSHSYPWRTWDAPFTGMELWSYMWDWIEGVGYHNFLRHYAFPDGAIHGPHPETIRTWDRLTRRRKVVAIGGLDVHARRRIAGLFVVFPYRYAFRTLLTYVMTPAPFRGERHADLTLLYQAIRSGHCYLSYEPLYPGRGFAVSARNGRGDTAVMGDALRWIPPVEIRIALPANASGRLLRNGGAVGRFTGRAHTMTVSEPGVYRVEVRLRDRPWLFSNPIYINLREDDAC